MHLTNTSQYAIRILICIAKSKDERLFSAKELSEKLNISYKFLTKVMISLVNHNFLISIKGREGGYKLARPSNEICILDILNLFHEFDKDKQCLLGVGLCDHTNKCGLHDQWMGPKDMIHNMFESTTLDQLEDDNFKL